MTQLPPRPVAEAALLIRRPIAEVFEAFVDPAITTRFWFSKSSGRLAPGKRIRWDWEMYGAVGEIEVQAVDPHRRILILWGYNGTMTPVEWTFEPRGEGATLVRVINSGFGGDLAAATADALDSTGGFALVLAGAKAWLEHGLELGLIPARHPDAIVSGWKGR